jgi:hypothetical protein
LVRQLYAGDVTVGTTDTPHRSSMIHRGFIADR